MSKRVFCGGLPWAAEDDDLRHAMEEFGPVEDAKVITDRDTGRSRGFGFVSFASEDDAEEAIRVGQIQMDQRTVRINEADERPERSDRSRSKGPEKARGGRRRRPQHDG